MLGMERLGETAEFGSLLIRLVGFDGWRLFEQADLFGDETMYWLARAPDEIVGPRIGQSLADVATDLCLEAMERRSPTRRRLPRVRTRSAVPRPENGRRA